MRDPAGIATPRFVEGDLLLWRRRGDSKLVHFVRYVDDTICDVRYRDAKGNYYQPRVLLRRLEAIRES